jgi:hypothetical protein
LIPILFSIVYGKNQLLKINQKEWHVATKPLPVIDVANTVRNFILYFTALSPVWHPVGRTVL